jgi:two-component system, OmpR family, sensor histidine kinase VicK
MNLLAISTTAVVALTGLLIVIIGKLRNKNKTLKSKIASFQKNHDYLVYLIRDLEDIFGYGSDLQNVIDVITKSLDSTYPYSMLSSVFLRGNKLLFKTHVKEPVNSAFLDKIKDTMVEELNLPKDQKFEREESTSGVALDNAATSEIKSSTEITIIVNFQTVAIVKLASTTAELYTEDDKKTFSALSYLVSGFLTRLEVLLKVEKSKSLAMIDSFSDGIFMMDTSSNLIAMNTAAQNFLNVHNAIPTLNDVLSVLPNTVNFQEKIGKCIRENRSITEENVTINGKIFKIVITPVLEMNAINRHTIGASVLLHDITLEKSLTQMKEDFTNIMVHELRSPLTAIKASSDFLMSKADLTPLEKERLMSMISESTKKMLDKISLILDSAKMDAGLFTIRKTDSDIKKLIKDRIAIFTPVAAEKFINLKVDIAENIPVFSFDPIRIDEVINNLLSNSLKFTPEHGTITLQAMLSSSKVIISVSDTGPGIAKDKQAKLFSKFQQAPDEGEHVGTGLGLYVVKEVIEKHGGIVSLNSDIGHGTTISFTLPLHTILSAPPPGIKPAAENTQKLVN